MDDVVCPAYYCVSRNLAPEQLASVLHALKITPISSVIIANIHDADLARNFGAEILRTNTLEDAVSLALTLSEDGRPTLVIGGAACLEAHYPDGHKEIYAS